LVLFAYSNGGILPASTAFKPVESRTGQLLEFMLAFFLLRGIIQESEYIKPV